MSPQLANSGHCNFSIRILTMTSPPSLLSTLCSLMLGTVLWTYFKSEGQAENRKVQDSCARSFQLAIQVIPCQLRKLPSPQTKLLSVLVCIMRLPGSLSPVIVGNWFPRAGFRLRIASFIKQSAPSKGARTEEQVQLPSAIIKLLVITHRIPGRLLGLSVEQKFGFRNLQNYFYRRLTLQSNVSHFHFIVFQTDSNKNIQKYPTLFIFNNASKGSELLLFLL